MVNFGYLSTYLRTGWRVTTATSTVFSPYVKIDFLFDSGWMWRYPDRIFLQASHPTFRNLGSFSSRVSWGSGYNASNPSFSSRSIPTPLHLCLCFLAFLRSSSFQRAKTKTKLSGSGWICKLNGGHSTIYPLPGIDTSGDQASFPSVSFSLFLFVKDIYFFEGLFLGFLRLCLLLIL